MVRVRNDVLLTSALLVFLASSLGEVKTEIVEAVEGDPVGLDLDAAEQHHRPRRSLFGKRITSSLVAELGKRPKDMYSFGIGKRSISDDEMAAFLQENKAAAAHGGEAEVHPEAAASSDLHYFTSDKRDPYAFGLGKRDPYAFGLGKRDPYAFGLGKRSGEYSFGLGRKRDPYAFGLGKRGGGEDMYAFGMGKKDAPYAFGLGKRDPYAFGLGKRDPYAFGLGKRDPYAFGLGKRDPYAFGLGRKRDPYSFGLGR